MLVPRQRWCLQQYWVGKEPYRFIGVREIAEAFKEYSVGRANAEALAVPFQASPDDIALIRTKFALSSERPAKPWKPCC